MSRLTRQTIRQRINNLRADRLLIDLLRVLPDTDTNLEALAAAYAISGIRDDQLGRLRPDQDLDRAAKRLSALACALSELSERYADELMDHHNSSLSCESAGGGADGPADSNSTGSMLPPALAAHARLVAERERDRLEIEKRLVRRGGSFKVYPAQVEHQMAERDAQRLREQRKREIPLVSLGQGTQIDIYG